jgi:uroporphyrinogen-III synthase
VVVTLANLVVTSPSWDDEVDPLSSSLADQGKKFWVDVFLSPKQLLKVSPAAVQKAMVRELEDWDDLTDVRPLILVATSPQAARAFAKIEPLVTSLVKRKPRLKYAAVGDDTALEFVYSLFESGIVRLKVEDILKPPVSGHIDKLADMLTEKLKPGTMVALLEARGDRGDFAQRLVAGGLRVTRLPVFSRENQDLVALPQSDNPWWFLITSSAYLKSLADDINAQKIDPNSVHWIGNVMSLKSGVAQIAPEARYHMVENFIPERILETISKY